MSHHREIHLVGNIREQPKSSGEGGRNGLVLDRIAEIER